MRFSFLAILIGCLLGSALHAQSESSVLQFDDVFDRSKLLIVDIEIPKEDWDQLRAQSRSFATGFANPNQKPYTYFKGDVTINGKKIESVGIRKKGFFGSADTTRPSLKIKFDEYVEQDPAKGFNRLTLNNNKQDGAQVSQLLTYELFNKAGIHAPKVSLAKVSVNGQSLGIYSNVESVKKPFLKKHFGDSSGNLYEGTITDFYPKAVDRLEVKTNDETNDKSDITVLADVLWAEKFDSAALAKMIDMDYFLKFWTIESLVGFWDGYAANQNNYFLYNHPQTGKLYFIPWGADWTLQANNPFSRGGFGGGRGFGGGGNSRPVTAVYAQAVIPNRLYREEVYKTKYKAAMMEVLKTAWDEDKMLAEIDRVEALVKDHLHSAQNSFERSLEQTRSFIKARRKQVTEALNGDPVSIPAEPRKPSYNVDLGQIKGELTTKWNDDWRANASDETVTLQLSLEESNIELEEAKVIAKAGRVFRFGPGGGGNQTPPATIEIRGRRKSDGGNVTLTFTLSQDQLKSSPGNEIKVSGRLTEGSGGRRGFGGFNQGKMIDAKFQFKTASVESEGAIKASFTGKVYENRGGLFGRRSNSTARRSTGSSRGTSPGGNPGSGSSANSTGTLETRTLESLDTDKDGELSIEEVKQATESLLRLDENKDGKISRQELSRRTGGSSREAPKPDRRPKFDQ